MGNSEAMRKKEAQEARERKEQARATFEAKVRRLHGTGATDADIARELGVDGSTVKRARERMGLAKNSEALFQGPRYG